MKDEIHFLNNKYGDGYMISQSHVGNNRAKLAVQMVERLALVAAKDEGEDSAGRQKIKTYTNEEIVQRSCDIADKLFTEFEKRGWLFEVPLDPATK